LSACSIADNAKDHALCEAICKVYAEQGLKSDDLAAGSGFAASDSGDETGGGSEVKPPTPKKPRRNSGGSSSATMQASQTFAQVMSSFMPPPPPQRLVAADWFAKVMATDEQKSAIKSLLPAAAGEPSTLLLAMIDEDDLKECRLSKIQIAAWKKLAEAERI